MMLPEVIHTSQSVTSRRAAVTLNPANIEKFEIDECEESTRS